MKFLARLRKLLRRYAANGDRLIVVETELKAARAKIAELHNTCSEYEEEIQELQVEKRLLTDRLEFSLSDRARVWDELRIALAEERRAYQMQINIDTQRHYGIAPYPDAPKLPDSRIPQAQDPGPAQTRMTPSQAVQDATATFMQEMRTRIQNTQAADRKRP